MHVDRHRALLLVTAIAACHGEQQRAPPLSVPPDEPRPSPSPGVSARGAPAPSVIGGAQLPDAGLEAAVTTARDARDASPTVDGAPDAGSLVVDASTPPPTTAELLRRCRALPKQSDCDDVDARSQCRVVVQEFSREAAARAVSCYEHIEGDCRGCDIRTCTQEALRGFARRGLRACEGVRKKVVATADEGYGQTMFELCEDYAAGMNDRGVQRFTTCLKQSIGIGVRFCLWDPSVTPCSEGNGQPLPGVGLDF